MRVYDYLYSIKAFYTRTVLSNGSCTCIEITNYYKIHALYGFNV